MLLSLLGCPLPPRAAAPLVHAEDYAVTPGGVVYSRFQDNDVVCYTARGSLTASCVVSTSPRTVVPAPQEAATDSVPPVPVAAVLVLIVSFALWRYLKKPR